MECQNEGYSDLKYRGTGSATLMLLDYKYGIENKALKSVNIQNIINEIEVIKIGLSILKGLRFRGCLIGFKKRFYVNVRNYYARQIANDKDTIYGKGYFVCEMQYSQCSLSAALEKL